MNDSISKAEMQCLKWQRVYSRANVAKASFRLTT